MDVEVTDNPDKARFEIVADGHGERFDANKGTPMKEWFSLDPASALPWPPLAREALDFARYRGHPAAHQG